MKKPFLFALFSLLAVAGWSENFRFLYAPGDKYRFISTVSEEVYINGSFSHDSEILNKVTVEVTKTDGTSGLLSSVFITSERNTGEEGVSVWGEEYHSLFWRNALGAYSGDEGQYMPVVRNVPIFPDRSISPGEAWSADGYEVHDFRYSLGIEDPYKFPIKVMYTYAGTETIDGRRLHKIAIDYTIFVKPPPPRRHEGLFPVRITGYSKQVLLWDNEAGMPASYEEEFEMVFTMNDGQWVEYRGTASADVKISERMDRDRIAEEVTRDLSDSGVTDTTVSATPEGVRITLEDIRFLPDSAVLLETEKGKLRVIADILKKYPDRDILVTGHTAFAKTEEGMQQLSEERARTVADFLLGLGVLSPERIIVRGMGGRMPVAGNDTEEGRKKNRRVEITILEN